MLMQSSCVHGENIQKQMQRNPGASHRAEQLQLACWPGAASGATKGISSVQFLRGIQQKVIDWVAQKQHKVTSPGCRGWKPKIEALAASATSEGLPPACQKVLHAVLHLTREKGPRRSLSFFCEDMASTVKTSLRQPDYLPGAPFPLPITLGVTSAT